MDNIDNPIIKKLFQKKKKPDLIRNTDLLSNDFVPDKIVARDEQIDIITDDLEPLMTYAKTRPLMAWGSTGVGKSATLQYISKSIIEGIKIAGLDIQIDTITVNCTTTKNDADVSREILNKLTGINRGRGKSAHEYQEDIWATIDNKVKSRTFYALILIFDEIDAYKEPDDLLYLFCRAKAQNFIQSRNVEISVILTSNNKNFIDKLNDRTRSTLNPILCRFPEYNEDELFEIIKLRKDAFLPGVITDDLLRQCAKNVAKNYKGDARMYFDILLESGNIAAKENSNKITEDYIHQAEKVVTTNVTFSMLQKFRKHDKILMRAVYIANRIAKQRKSKRPPHSGVIYAAYNAICSVTGENPNADTHVSTRINFLSGQGMLYADFIKGCGNTRFIRLSKEVEPVIEDLFEENFNKNIVNNYSDIESVIITKLKTTPTSGVGLDNF